MEDLDAVAQILGGRQVRLDLGLIADEDDAHLRVFLHRLDRSSYDWAGRMIAPHRVERDSHGLALLGFLDDDRFTPLRVVPAAVAADEVRLNCFAASDAIRILARL
jgi:hypothetical protein